MADQSHLSKKDMYGYDFVIATTQASINSGLLQFLQDSKPEATSLCFCADDLGNPTNVYKLEDFLQKFEGVADPFTIPDGSPIKDGKIQQLLETAWFMCAIRIQMGLPRDVLPKDLPPVVNLSHAESVGFNTFCSEFTVIQLNPGTYGHGSWNVWKQPSDQAWLFGTQVDLLSAPLSQTLDDVLYFEKHEAEKQAVLRQLSKISGADFSLQQILYDLEHAKLVTMPDIGGLEDGSPARTALDRYFIGVYAKHCLQEGLPLFGVAATMGSGSDDPSQLQMTSVERQISLLKGNDGVPLDHPTPAQLDVTTLDYLCMTDHKRMPGRADFGWNWVQPNEVDNESGVISINRDAVADIFVHNMLPALTKSCICVVPWVKGENIMSWIPTVKVDPQVDGAFDKYEVVYGEDGSHIISLSYSRDKRDDDNWSAAWYAAVRITTDYTVDVYIQGTTVKVIQHYKVYLWMTIQLTKDDLNAYDFTRTDTYTISVGQFGNLQLRLTGSEPQDRSDDPHRSGFVNFFTHIDDIIKRIQNDIVDIETTHLSSLQFDQLQSFVFPASKTFAFKDPRFSDFQDLVCNITYVDPNATSITHAQLCDEAKDQGHTLLEGDFPAQNGLKLTYSTELLDNYVQGEIVAPRSKFEALQARDGHALLFAMDSASVFHVLKEQSGNVGYRMALRGSLLPRPGTMAGKAKVRTFDVGQSAVDGSIGLALAVSCGDFDTLFVSLGNDNTNTDWTSHPQWRRIPFDDVSEQPEVLRVVGVMFVETSKKDEFLVVDIDRPSSTSSDRHVARYNIDFSNEHGSYWVKQDVPVDIDDGNYQSTVGRVQNGRVDGVYTSGFAGQTPQLVYVPVENVFGSGPPLPRRLSLPDTTSTHPIAAARFGDPASDFLGLTDLFCIGGSTLYRYAADQQQDGSQAVPLVTSDSLAGSDQLQVMMDHQVVTLCGRNGSNELFYTSCPISQVSMPGSWSAVVPILKGVERFSTFINAVDGSNTVFASGDGKLFKLTQSSATGAKIWRVQEIALAARPTEKPLAFSSYTTTLHVSGEDDLPTADIELEISANAMTPFYINGLYYLVGPQPIHVPTNSAGIVTVVEAAAGLDAAILTVSIRHGPTSTIINPMQKAFDKLAALDSETALREASIQAKTTAGGTLRPAERASLVEPTTQAADLEQIAAHMGGLRKAWDGAKPPSFTGLARLDRTCPRVVPATAFLGHPSVEVEGFGGAIAIACGDLFRWLKTGVEALIDVIEDTATKAWHFVAKIAGKVYRAVLDTVEAIVGAIEWVFDLIKTRLEKLVRFVQFLFAWGDIRRTKDVLASLTKLYLRHQLGQMGAAKAAFDGQIDEARKTLHQWAAIDDWSALGDASSKLARESARSPAKGQTSASMLFASHYRANAQHLTVVGPPAGSSASNTEVEGVIEAFLEALLSHGDVLSGIYSDLKALAPKISTMSLAEMLKAFGALLADGILLSTQAVVDALLDTLTSLGDGVLEIMDTKIHIPVISDILEMIGIPSISFLDLFLWIGAVSCDVVYKVTYNQAPFPDNDEVNAVISAQSWEVLTKMFEAAGSTESAAVSLPNTLRKVIHLVGHATAGFCLFMSDFVVVFEAEAPTGENPFSIPAAVLGATTALLDGAAGTLAPACPVENTAVRVVSAVTSAAVVASKVLFSGSMQKKLASPDSRFHGLAVGDGRATSAVVDAVLVVPQLFVTGWHFYELSRTTGGGGPAHTAAVLGEASHLTGYASKLCYAAAVNDGEPTSRQVAIAAMLVLNVATGGLQTAEAFYVEEAAIQAGETALEPDRPYRPVALRQVPVQGKAKTRQRHIGDEALTRSGMNGWDEKPNRLPYTDYPDYIWNGRSKVTTTPQQIGLSKSGNSHALHINRIVDNTD